MKNLKFLTLLFASFFMLTLASCDKDDEEKISPNLENLTAGVWKGSAVYYQGNDVSADLLKEGFDITKYRSEFKREGTYKDSYEGSVITEGTWEFENDERGILFDKNTDDKYSVTISKLDDNELNYLQDGFEFRFVK